MSDIHLRVDQALQQILGCLHPTDSRWLKEKVQKQSLLSEFTLLLDQQELEAVSIDAYMADYPELQVYTTLLEPQSQLSERLKSSIRKQLLQLAEVKENEAIYAD